MAHHSEKSHWAAHFAMRQAQGDTRAAKRLYKEWVPEEPVSKWAKFATEASTKLATPIKSLSEVPHGKPGPKPIITDSLARKISTVYTQRLVWEHGLSRHYRNMAEVRRHDMPGALAWPAHPAQHPASPIQLH